MFIAKSILEGLVHYATLAPSSHNTQCWKFRLEPHGITVFPDFERRCPVVDPDDHHLYVSLGCAVENLVIAAKANGFDAEVDAAAPDQQGISVGLRSSAGAAKDKDNDQLFQAIPHRQCTRCEYDGSLLSKDELSQLEQAAGKSHGVRIHLLTNDDQADMMDTVKDYVIRANTAQLRNNAFKDELKTAIRFNEKEAKTTGDGLFGKCMGHPSVPRWLGGLILDFAVTEKAENNKISKLMDSSAGLAVFVSDRDDPSHWVEAGRCYQRFALKATAMGVKTAFLNQPVEEKEVRTLFAKAIGLSDTSRPDLVVRFGKGPDMPRSYRRPLEEVLVAGSETEG